MFLVNRKCVSSWLPFRLSLVALSKIPRGWFSSFQKKVSIDSYDEEGVSGFGGVKKTRVSVITGKIRGSTKEKYTPESLMSMGILKTPLKLPPKNQNQKKANDAAEEVKSVLSDNNNNNIINSSIVSEGDVFSEESLDLDENVDLSLVIDHENIEPPPQINRYQKWRTDFPVIPSSFTPEYIDQVNRSVFDNTSFKPLQKDAIEGTLKRKDLFLLLPTGGGKSLTFQLPAVISPGVTIVVSPLLALIHDQLRHMRELGIPTEAIHSNVSSSKYSEIIRQLKSDQVPIKLLYTTPERCENAEFISILKNLNSRGLLSRFVIDEVHCISEWGHDFRKSYRKLCSLKTSFPSVPILAVTASATFLVRKDILSVLGIQKAVVLATSFNRPNIFYSVHRKDTEPYAQIGDWILDGNYKEESGIIYCTTTKDCELLCEILSKTYDIASGFYHGAMSALDKAKMYEGWVKGSYKVLCTTIAFGLGIDKPDIRYVLHFDMPSSLELYYQQTGRAGRDGKKSQVVLFFSPSDLMRVKGIISRSFKQVGGNESILSHKIEKIQKVADFCQNTWKCRRQVLLDYFGETIHRSKCNQMCDVCYPKGGQKNSIKWKPYTLKFQRKATSEVGGTSSLLIKKAKPRASVKKQTEGIVIDENTGATESVSSGYLFILLNKELTQANQNGKEIFSKSTVVSIARKKPTDMQTLTKIRGVGKAKAAEYGDLILSIVNRNS